MADPLSMLRALAHPDRLRLLAKISDGGVQGRSIDELRDSAIGDEQLRDDLKRLLDAELIDADGVVLVARLDRMRHAHAPATGAAAVDRRPADVGRYFEGERLKGMPRAPETRRAVLERIARRFEGGRTYIEGDVNALLREVYDDAGELRRNLVELGLLERDARGTAYRVPRGGAAP